MLTRRQIEKNETKSLPVVDTREGKKTRPTYFSEEGEKQLINNNNNYKKSIL
jgi:hypothetical protein